MIKRFLAKQRSRFRGSAGVMGAAYRLYTVLSFSREIRTLRAGQVQHMKLRQEGDERYSLRRHIHMIEKGLVMSPRRPVFAESYIDETVSTLCKLDQAYVDTNNDVEYIWFVSVLKSYFSVVSLRDSPVAARAHERFRRHFEEQGRIVSFDERSAPFSVQSTTRSSVSPLEFQGLLANRSSVRWFTDTHVPRELLDRASVAAAESPSACNRQPYRIIIIDDPQLVSKVAHIPGGTRGYAHNVPCIAVFVGDQSAFSEERDRHLVYIDSSLAAMSFVLSLEVDGLSSCCINWPDVSSREAELRSVLNIFQYETVIMLVAIGYSDPEGSVPSSRKRSLEHVRQYNDST